MKMSDTNDVKPGNKMVLLKLPKQTLILLTIFCLTLITATSNGLYRAGVHRDFGVPLSAPGVLLMLILTEWKGRRVLFITLFILSLLSSLLYLSQLEIYFDYRILCVMLHAPVKGSAIVLLYTVISEYCDPKRRFFCLIANSAIQMLFYWITFVLDFNNEHLEFFGSRMQYVNVVLGVLGIWSVFKWPESPHWLASKGRFQESAKAFVEVRGYSESEECRVLTDAKPRASSLKMFLYPILTAFPIFCMAIPTDTEISLMLYEYMLLEGPSAEFGNYWIFLASKCCTALLCVLTALVPIGVSRKVLFLSCAFIFLVNLFCLVATLLTEVPVFILALDAIVNYGPRIVTLPLLIEMIPQKYTSLVTAVVSILYVIMEYFQIDISMLPINVFSGSGGFIILVTVIIAYFLMPDTKEKTLIEIEESYVSKKAKPPQTIQTEL